MNRITCISASPSPGGPAPALTDIRMPNMDGYKATQLIRRLQDPRKADIPIIAMTANAFAEDVHAAKTAGMNEHIAKPLDLNTLAKVLSKWL